MKRVLKNKVKQYITNRRAKARNYQLNKSFNIKLTTDELNKLKLCWVGGGTY